MTVTPKRNLPPESEPWGRSIENRLDQSEAQSRRQTQDINNTLAGVNGSLVRLSEQVGEIRVITETLVQQQATLQAQQEQLQAQQSQLTQTVGELQTVVNGMIRPASQQSSVGGLVVSPTQTLTDSVLFGVPPEYSRALVTAMSGLSVLNSGSANDLVYNRIEINGISSGEAFNGVSPGSWEQVSVQSTRIITVSGLTNFTVSSFARSAVGTYTNSGNGNRLVVQVLFLR